MLWELLSIAIPYFQSREKTQMVDVIPETNIKIVTPPDDELPKSFKEVVAESILNLNDKVQQIESEINFLKQAFKALQDKNIQG